MENKKPESENQIMCSLTQSYFDFINYELYLSIFQYLDIKGKKKKKKKKKKNFYKKKKKKKGQL